MNEDQARERVIHERKARGYFSGRAAAGAAVERGARISATTWNDWESGKRNLGDAIRRAVMVLFDWPSDWAEHPPVASPVVEPDGEQGDLVTQLAAVEELARSLGQAVLALLQEASGRLGADDELAAKLDALERVVAQQLAR